MHILIALHDWNAGGTERVAMALAKSWLAAGDTVTILVGHDQGPARALAPEGAKIMALASAIPRGPASQLRLGGPMAVAATALKPDAIFLPGNFHLMLARHFARLRPKPVIVGKLSNPLWPYAVGGSVAGPLLRWWMAGADTYAAMNGSLAEHTRQLLGPSVRVVIAEDPLLVPRANPPEPADPNRFVAIGRLEPQKDMALAIRTLAELRRLRREARLDIVGQGPELPALQSLAASLGVAGAVRFIGQVADVTAVLDGAAALLVTSRYEGGPAVAIEALARGVPVVSTDCSALLRSVLVTPGAGRLLTSRDPVALARALAEQTFRPDPATLDALRRFDPMTAAARYQLLFAG